MSRDGWFFEPDGRAVERREAENAARSNGLCESCVQVEVTQALACYDREKAAKASGQAFFCNCPTIICRHASSDSGSTEGEG